MLDPLLFQLIAVSFCLLLIAAGLHKLSDRFRFRGILAAYQIVPAILIAPLSLLIPLTEISLGLGWAIGWETAVVSTATAFLFAVYGVAMSINLMRGRRYIDCGCGLSSAKAQSADNGVQQLSVWLVCRNILLIGFALAAGAGMDGRDLAALDFITLAAATLALVFVYGAFHQLLVNHNAIDSWRKPLLVELTAGEEND